MIEFYPLGQFGPGDTEWMNSPFHKTNELKKANRKNQHRPILNDEQLLQVHKYCEKNPNLDVSVIAEIFDISKYTVQRAKVMGVKLREIKCS